MFTLVREHSTTVRLSQGTNANTPYFQVLAPELGHDDRACPGPGTRSQSYTWALNGTWNTQCLNAKLCKRNLNATLRKKGVQ